MTNWRNQPFPEDPGVYLMKNSHHQILYIGKAKNLKKRLASYTQKNLSIKTQHLVKDISEISYFILSSELEALLLERQLVKIHQPKYNVLLRDDKDYPYIKVTLADAWPRFSRAKSKRENHHLYLGPYGSSGAVEKALQTVQSLFPLIRCSPYEFQKAKKPCSYFELKRCQAPCVGFLDEKAYGQIVYQAVSFLKGENLKLKKSLEKSMKKAAQEEQFEQAVLYRDQLKALQTLKEEQSVILKDLKEADLFVVGLQKSLVYGVVLSVRKNRLIHKSHLRFSPGVEAHLGLESFIFDFYDGVREVPSLILLSEIFEGSVILNQALEKKFQTHLTIRGVQTKEERALLDLGNQNLIF